MPSTLLCPHASLRSASKPGAGDMLCQLWLIELQGHGLTIGFFTISRPIWGANTSTPGVVNTLMLCLGNREVSEPADRGRVWHWTLIIPTCISWWYGCSCISCAFPLHHRDLQQSQKQMAAITVKRDLIESLSDCMGSREFLEQSLLTEEEESGIRRLGFDDPRLPGRARGAR